MKRVHVKIHGIVQGVFFRQHVKELASSLGIKGWIKNITRDVEAVFEGSEEDINKMVNFCREGPDSAEVDNLEIKEEEYVGGFDGFEIRY